MVRLFTFAGGVFFLDAPGGAGKTFLLNTVLATIRSRCEIAPATASSGIAATLLSDCKAIIVDEAPMIHHCAFEAVDRALHDIRSVDAPFRGITTLLCGDFWQILPVVRNGTRANILISSWQYLWPSISVLHLITNMRVHL